MENRFEKLIIYAFGIIANLFLLGGIAFGAAFSGRMSIMGSLFTVLILISVIAFIVAGFATVKRKEYSGKIGIIGALPLLIIFLTFFIWPLVKAYWKASIIFFGILIIPPLAFLIRRKIMKK